jgi:hypothetical protein
LQVVLRLCRWCCGFYAGRYFQARYPSKQYEFGGRQVGSRQRQNCQRKLPWIYARFLFGSGFCNPAGAWEKGWLETKVQHRAEGPVACVTKPQDVWQICGQNVC